MSNKREELEARVVAYLLGEAGDFESAEVERLLEEDTELSAFARRMEKTLSLTKLAVQGFADREAEQEPKLDEGQREVLMTLFRGDDRRPFEEEEATGAPAEERRRSVFVPFWKHARKHWVALQQIAALLVICAVVAAALIPAASYLDHAETAVGDAALFEFNGSDIQRGDMTSEAKSTPESRNAVGEAPTGSVLSASPFGSEADQKRLDERIRRSRAPAQRPGREQLEAQSGPAESNEGFGDPFAGTATAPKPAPPAPAEPAAPQPQSQPQPSRRSNLLTTRTGSAEGESANLNGNFRRWADAQALGERVGGRAVTDDSLVTEFERDTRTRGVTTATTPAEEPVASETRNFASGFAVDGANAPGGGEPAMDQGMPTSDASRRLDQVEISRYEKPGSSLSLSSASLAPLEKRASAVVGNGRPPEIAENAQGEAYQSTTENRRNWDTAAPAQQKGGQGQAATSRLYALGIPTEESAPDELAGVPANGKPQANHSHFYTDPPSPPKDAEVPNLDDVAVVGGLFDGRERNGEGMKGDADFDALSTNQSAEGRGGSQNRDSREETKRRSVGLDVAQDEMSLYYDASGITAEVDRFDEAAPPTMGDVPLLGALMREESDSGESTVDGLGLSRGVGGKDFISAGRGLELPEQPTKPHPNLKHRDTVISPGGPTMTSAEFYAMRSLDLDQPGEFEDDVDGSVVAYDPTATKPSPGQAGKEINERLSRMETVTDLGLTLDNSVTPGSASMEQPATDANGEILSYQLHDPSSQTWSYSDFGGKLKDAEGWSENDSIQWGAVPEREERLAETRRFQRSAAPEGEALTMEAATELALDLKSRQLEQIELSKEIATAKKESQAPVEINGDLFAISGIEPGNVGGVVPGVPARTTFAKKLNAPSTASAGEDVNTEASLRRLLDKTRNDVTGNAAALALVAQEAAREVPWFKGHSDAKPADFETALELKKVASADDFIFEDAELGTTLSAIAERAGVDLLVPDDLNGRVSLRLRGVAWEDAMTVALDDVGYDYGLVSDGTVVVRSRGSEMTAETPEEIVASDSLSRQEKKIKLLTIALRARQAKNYDEARARLEDLLRLDPEDENIQQLMYELNATMEAEIARSRRGEDGDPPAQPTPRPPATPLPVTPVADQPLSTFSLNVSDVSFKLAKGYLDEGRRPPAEGIRSEEFVNAFDYRDDFLARGPIRFFWEIAGAQFEPGRDLLRFSAKAAISGREQGVPLNIVLAVDRSGSMGRVDREEITRAAVGVLASQLKPDDSISLVTFDRTASLLADGVSGADAGNLAQRLHTVRTHGGTNLENGIGLAYSIARKHFLPRGNNRVILFTDGAANLGNTIPEELKETISHYRDKGIAFDVFGIGLDEYNDSLLENLARNGDGRYGFLSDVRDVRENFALQLVGALQVAASNVKVQVEFNPNRVADYRQIGYKQHQLKAEDFRDNTVDAAEIGASESGNALYSVRLLPNGEGPLGVVRVRFKDPASGLYREREWELEAPTSITPLEDAPPAMRLAATAAAFAEKLGVNAYAAEVEFPALLRTLQGVPEHYAPDPRPAQLETMIRQAMRIME